MAESFDDPISFDQLMYDGCDPNEAISFLVENEDRLDQVFAYSSTYARMFSIDFVAGLSKRSQNEFIRMFSGIQDDQHRLKLVIYQVLMLLEWQLSLDKEDLELNMFKRSFISRMNIDKKKT